MLSSLIKFCPPVRRGNDLQETGRHRSRVSSCSSQAGRQAGNAQWSDEAIMSVWKWGANPNPKTVVWRQRRVRK